MRRILTRVGVIRARIGLLFLLFENWLSALSDLVELETGNDVELFLFTWIKKRLVYVKLKFKFHFNNLGIVTAGVSPRVILLQDA